jgi:hypothetical protein
MARALPLFGMAAGVQLEGTTLAQGKLRNSEIQQRIREALEETDTTFLVEGHLPMRPYTGFVNLVSISRHPSYVLLHSLTLTFDFTCRRMQGRFSPFRNSHVLLKEDDAARAANRAADEA